MLISLADVDRRLSKVSVSLEGSPIVQDAGSNAVESRLWRKGGNIKFHEGAHSVYSQFLNA
jgi:hypothetical protein